MRISVSIFIVLFLPLVSKVFAEPVVLETDHLRLAIAETGNVVEFVDKRDGVNHVDPPRDARFCILRPKKEGPHLGSNRIERDGDTQTVSFADSSVRAKIRYKTETDRIVYDASGAEIGEMTPSAMLPEIPKGRSTIRFSGKNASGRDSVVRLTVRSAGNPFE